MSITQRGMSMRSMKAGQGRGGRPTKAATAARQRADAEAPPADESELESEPLDDGVLLDQGDGVRVLERSRRAVGGEGRCRDLPDEPPPGWGEP